jgi:hypothetical protein
MTPEEFMLSVKPDLPERRVSSRLVPHREAIEKLRASGYSLALVVEYLEKCGVNVSIQMVSKFLRGPSAPRSRAAQQPPARAPQNEPTASATPAPMRPALAPPASSTKTREQLLSENPGLGKREIEQMYVDQFQTTQQNPLLRRRNQA